MKATSRTHEENQERAYIAASRRSDRSVEARVESARRASEIHKRRTGKGLKVSEKDVLADEMYEEEDDELPAQYRNLNAHLQTGSSDFDARLQAYLANAVAFRKALSGVTKPGDKKQHADFVNKKQLADHTSLFPKHSDAWKDIVIPKCNDSSRSPFLPQGSSLVNATKFSPYNAKNSSLGHRRMSSSKSMAIDNMGTLKASDLKERRTTYPVSDYPRSAPAQKSPRSITPDYSTSGINYDAIDKQTINDNASTYPFSAQLPANAMDMLMHDYQTTSESNKGLQSMYGTNTYVEKQEDSIDSTLVPAFKPPKMTAQVAPENSWNPVLWEETANQRDSAATKLLESDMWGSYIDENSTQAWDWHNEMAV